MIKRYGTVTITEKEIIADGFVIDGTDGMDAQIEIQLWCEKRLHEVCAAKDGKDEN